MKAARRRKPSRAIAWRMGLACLGAWLAWMPVPAKAGIPARIFICDVGSEWPPYTYYKRQNGRATAEVIGISADFVKEILQARHIAVSIELLPWRRCLMEVANGDHYAMLFNASLNPERKANYLVSKPYYTLRDVYFYAKDRPPPRIAGREDLLQYKMCGQAGYNYQNFGVRNDQIDTGTARFGDAMEKLKKHRCDIVLGRWEIAAGHQLTDGIDYTQSDQFEVARIPGVGPVTFHMLVNPRLPYSGELLDLLNRAIDERARRNAGPP